MTEYLENARCLADTLTAISHPVSDEDLILYVLSDLDPDYAAFVTSITTWSDSISYNDSYNLLLTQEYQNELLYPATTDLTPVFASLSTKSSQHAPNFSAGLLPSPPQHTINWARGGGRTNFFGRGRGCQNRGNSSFSYGSSLSNVPRVVCQICNKAPAIRCCKRFDLVPSLLPPTRQLCMLLPPPTLI